MSNTFKLPNGNPIDTETLELALEDASLENSYFLNTETGEVVFFSMDGYSEVTEETEEEIDGSDNYVRIESIPSSQAYDWMRTFVDEEVAPHNERVAEKLSFALLGKGPFRRFKDAISNVDDKWLQAWYRWKETCLHDALVEWFADNEIDVTEEQS
ncbi:MAG TPA: UPF0158 family protein [Ktedonobacteraceae bacterium]|jgi:hypothetical protein|nr:UPF0158 family protein [Ktedonobacteraceae bacterium]